MERSCVGMCLKLLHLLWIYTRMQIRAAWLHLAHAELMRGRRAATRPLQLARERSEVQTARDKLSALMAQLKLREEDVQQREMATIAHDQV
jgi:hypothetical protein